MSKYKIGDEVEVKRLDGLAIGQVVTVVGHYQSMSGKLDGVVVRVGDGPGLYTCHQSHVKPVPPKPREWWINQYHDMAEEAYLYDSKEAAEAANKEACDDPEEELKLRSVRVREVLEDQE